MSNTTHIGNASRHPWWSVALILCVSCAYESIFVRHGLNMLDEAWQLYGAMRMHQGGVLYEDVLWVFPPAHIWTAWFAYWIDPPGIVLARIIYAGFSVAAALGIYFVARRLMHEPFAVLAALLVALAAPRGHTYQLLFGYRYLVWILLALLAFSRREEGGGPRWIYAAGGLIGVAVTFRLTPAFSAACGILVGLFACHRDWRAAMRDGLRFGVGILAVVAPTLAWFGASVGLDRFWLEVVVHPLAMLQPLPTPPLRIPEFWSRRSLTTFFVSLQFRAIWGLYAVYIGALGGLWLRARLRREPFRHALLLAVSVTGAVFFIRSLGRSDEPHLDSVIPPVCLLVAHGLSLLFGRVWPSSKGAPRRRELVAVAVVCAALASWIFLLGVDRTIRDRFNDPIPLLSTGGRISHWPRELAVATDRTVQLLMDRVEPGGVILNLSPTPIFHVLADRTGPGYFDIIMPGTFFAPGDEAWFLARLKENPPGAVIWPRVAFDEMPERSIQRTAPLITKWVQQNYRPIRDQRSDWVVYTPRKRLRRGDAS